VHAIGQQNTWETHSAGRIDQLWDLLYLCCWYYGAVTLGFLFLWVGTRIIIGLTSRTDPLPEQVEYYFWRKAGGDVFFDCLWWPWNADSQLARTRMLQPEPAPQPFCPRCGGPMNLNYGTQCGNCYVWWDGRDWRGDPDERYLQYPVDRLNEPPRYESHPIVPDDTLPLNPPPLGD